MTTLDSETTLEIQAKVDERISRYIKAMAAVAAIILAFTGIGLWQFLDMAQKNAVSAAKLEARTAIGYDIALTKELAESHGEKLSQQSQIEDNLSRSRDILGAAQQKSKKLIDNAEETVLYISEKKVQIEKKMSEVNNIVNLSLVTESINEIVNRLIDDTEFRQAVVDELSPAPAGLVAAYFPSESTHTTSVRCPRGWSAFSAADGRVLIGIGRASEADRKFQLGDIGGNTEVSLSNSNLPTHTHELDDRGHTHTALAPEMRERGSAAQGWPRNDIHYRFRTSDRGKGSPQAAAEEYPIHPSAISSSLSNLALEAAGKSEPLDAMPPYFALVFCKKD